MDEKLIGITARIRSMRKERGLSIQQLAERSGVAPSSVHKIEAGRMVPSVVVLLKIADGLGCFPGDLITNDPAESEVVLTRAKKHPRVSVSPKLRFERLSADLVDPSIEVWRVWVKPGSGSGRGEFNYDGEQVVVCEEGELTLCIGEDEYRMTEGDSIHFKARAPHSWQNRGADPARFLVVGNFPIELPTRASKKSALAGSGKS